MKHHAVVDSFVEWHELKPGDVLGITVAGCGPPEWARIDEPATWVTEKDGVRTHFTGRVIALEHHVAENVCVVVVQIITAMGNVREEELS